MPSIKLFVDPVSQPARACMWAVLANESEQDVEIVKIQLMKADHLTPEYLAMNPYHSIPTLKDEENGLVLYESGAILQYLSEKLNWKTVTIPSATDDVNARFKAINYLHFHHFRVRQNCMKAVGARIAPLMGRADSVDNAAIKAAIETGKEWYPIFDRQLKENGGFIAGSYMTLADFQAYSEFSFFLSNEYGFDLFNFKDYVNITEWISKMQQAPKYAEAFEACKPVSIMVANLAPSSNQD